MTKYLFIVIEGLDSSGKTSLAKSLSEENDNFVYLKAMSSENIFGRFVKKFPFTIMFLLDLIFLTYFFIKPLLRNRKIVYQDRYDLSLKTYIPLSKMIYNRFF